LKKITLIIALIIVVITAALIVPMQYRVISYETEAMGTKYGFEGRRGIFGTWHDIGYGADTREMAEKWIKMQPRFYN